MHNESKDNLLNFKSRIKSKKNKVKMKNKKIKNKMHAKYFTTVYTLKLVVICFSFFQILRFVIFNKR